MLSYVPKSCKEVKIRKELLIVADGARVFQIIIASEKHEVTKIVFLQKFEDT